MARLRVGIIFGGESAEHEVSLRSAENIVNEIDKSRFEVLLIGIDKQGRWHIYDVDNYLFNTSSSSHIALSPSRISVAVIPGQKRKQLINAKNAQALTQIDVIFPIIHGSPGEDGSLQGILQTANLPFVGSDVLGSAICMDKDITKRLLRDAGLKVAPFITLTYENYSRYSFSDLSSHLGLPLFVKPANQGSSVGVNKINSETQFNDSVNLAFKFSHKIVVEASIDGREIECAVIGNDLPQASTCGEIIINNDFYSYSNKYTCNNSTQVIVPALIDSEISNIIREVSITAYQVLGCCGMARVDVFLTPENEVIINEINTLPGFTNTSTYPKLWQASGFSYSALISKLIELAVERHTNYRTLKIPTSY